MPMDSKTRLVIIAGPTASGKTALAVELARSFGGEVISADSMQVYRRMDIGTAKPSKDELAGVAHHLIDIADPDEDYTAARFAADAAGKIREIESGGKVPFVAGGTGLYIRALTEGLFEGPGSDRELRARLVETAASRGRAALHEMLRAVDPVSAGRIHQNNLHRVIRALEVYELSGMPISGLQNERGQRRYECLKIGLSLPRDELYGRIEARVERMMAAGLLEETRVLLSAGYASGLKPMSALGYKEMCGHLNGEYPLEEAVALLKRNTRRYAKRQLTWFRKDPEIKWFAPGEKDNIMALVKGFLGR